MTPEWASGGSDGGSPSVYVQDSPDNDDAPSRDDCPEDGGGSGSTSPSDGSSSSGNDL